MVSCDGGVGEESKSSPDVANESISAINSILFEESIQRHFSGYKIHINILWHANSSSRNTMQDSRRFAVCPDQNCCHCENMGIQETECDGDVIE